MLTRSKDTKPRSKIPKTIAWPVELIIEKYGDGYLQPGELMKPLSDKMGRISMGVQLHYAKVADNTYVALLNNKHEKGDEFKVEKLRGKRLRLISDSYTNQDKYGKLAKGCEDDDWVKRLKSECPYICENMLVIPEYLVHWKGWTDEDDSWKFVENTYIKKRYNKLMEDLPRIQNIMEMIYEPTDDDLKQQKELEDKKRSLAAKKEAVKQARRCT